MIMEWPVSSKRTFKQCMCASNPVYYDKGKHRSLVGNVREQVVNNNAGKLILNDGNVVCSADRWAQDPENGVHRLLSRPPGSQIDIVAKAWCYNFRVCHVMLCGPKRLFLSHLHGERHIYKSVDNFFERPNCREMTRFINGIWFIRSDNIWKV